MTRITESLLRWAEQQALELPGGTGAKQASINLVLQTPTQTWVPWSLYDSGRGALLHTNLDRMGSGFAAGSDARARYCRDLSEASGQQVSPERSYPGIQLGGLGDPGSLGRVQAVLERELNDLRAN